MNKQNSVQLDESLFATLRIITIFLTIDGRVHSKERAWFQWLIKNRVADPVQTAQLTADLSNPPSMEHLIDEVRSEDRERLLAWARIAIHVDGLVDRSEKDLYDRLSALIQKSGPYSLESNQTFGRSLIEADSRRRFWDELSETAQFWRRPVRLRDLIFPEISVVEAFLSGNPYLIAVMIIFLLVIFGISMI